MYVFFNIELFFKNIKYCEMVISLNNFTHEDEYIINNL